MAPLSQSNRSTSSGQSITTSDGEELSTQRLVTPSPVRDVGKDKSERSSSTREQRRRKEKKEGRGDGQNRPTERRFGLGRKKSSKKKQGSATDDDLDPYDSDPGESYRQHCLRVKGEWSKSCLGASKKLIRKNCLSASTSSTSSAASNRRAEEETTLTAPAPSASSPHSSSDTGDSSEQIPPSLPSNTALARYSLRSSITDGSERQPAGSSAMEQRDLRPNTVHINISHWSDFGDRSYMEDRYVIEGMDAVQVEVSSVPPRKPENDDVEVACDAQKSRRVTMPLTFCGVFDGHGGDKASQFCADWMSSYIRSDSSYPYDLGYAMKNAYIAADKDFINSGQTDGTTACTVTIVGGRRVVCANAGDSRAIVVRRDGSIVRLSRDHKPGIPDETRRISDLGGSVIYWGRWRVEGLLAVSRSVGDVSLKPYITAEPEICEYDIGKDDWFLILSSDGVWDVMDNEEVAHVVIASACAMEDGKLMIDTDRFKCAARNLADHARSCGSTDNFAVIVVDLKSCGNPAATEGCYEP